jgi:transposase
MMESCGGVHWLARQIGALGHPVKLIAPRYVKPFVKGNKNDFGSASRPRFIDRQRHVRGQRHAAH